MWGKDLQVTFWPKFKSLSLQSRGAVAEWSKTIKRENKRQPKDHWAILSLKKFQTDSSIIEKSIKNPGLTFILEPVVGISEFQKSDFNFPSLFLRSINFGETERNRNKTFQTFKTEFLAQESPSLSLILFDNCPQMFKL